MASQISAGERGKAGDLIAKHYEGKRKKVLAVHPTILDDLETQARNAAIKRLGIGLLRKQRHELKEKLEKIEAQIKLKMPKSKDRYGCRGRVDECSAISGLTEKILPQVRSSHPIGRTLDAIDEAESAADKKLAGCSTRDDLKELLASLK